MSNKLIQDGRNRCKRCNRPLNNPHASYSWWCAKLLGLDFYVEEDRNLDDDDLSVYNEDSKDNATYIMSSHHFDKIRYGENSKAFIALDNLKRAHEAFPEYKDAINIVDNEIRRIVNKWGSERIETEIKSFDNTIAKFNKILSEEDKFNVSLSTVEQVLAVAHPMQAACFDMARKKADKLTAEIYGEDGNGTHRANAFKHIYWSAYATKMVGEDYARLFYPCT